MAAFYIKNKTFYVFLLGTVLIIAGYIITNDYEKKLSSTNKQIPKYIPGIAALSSILGLVVFVYGMGLRSNKLKPRINRKGIFAMIALLLLVGHRYVELLEASKEMSPDLAMVLRPMTFVCGWLLLGYLSGLKSYSKIAPRMLSGSKAYFGLSGSLMIILGLKFGLKNFEPLNKYIPLSGGPVFFTTGLLSIGFANSLQIIWLNTKSNLFKELTKKR